jgi:hypothetical protein
MNRRLFPIDVSGNWPAHWKGTLTRLTYPDFIPNQNAFMRSEGFGWLIDYE